MLIGIDGNEANVKNKVGSNTYAFEILRELKKRNSNTEYLIYLKKKQQPDLPLQSKNWHYKILKPERLWTQFRLPLELFFSTIKPHLLFSPGHYGPRFCPMPLVISIMDLAFLRFPEQFRKKDLFTLSSWTKYSVKKAKKILTISEATKKDIIKYYQVEPEKILVTYPGYDRKKFKETKDLLRIKKTLDKFNLKSQYIIYVGTIQPRKNLEKLIEAFAEVINCVNYPLALVIIGKKGWLYESVFQKPEQLKIEEKVLFLDFIKSNELAHLLNSALCFVLPSLYEGFGIPVLEAMACGTPVVLSNGSSLPEVAGDLGIYVDPQKKDDIAKGIIKAIKIRRSGNYQVFKNRLIAKAQKFSWDKCGEKTYNLLQEVAYDVAFQK